MSYEGYEEKLCENGHLSSCDAYKQKNIDTCGFCKKSFVFIHNVDETNGPFYLDDGTPHPDTIPYPFKEIGFDDDWKEDYYGNRYAKKVPRYEIPEKEKQQ